MDDKDNKIHLVTEKVNKLKAAPSNQQAPLTVTAVQSETAAEAKKGKEESGQVMQVYWIGCRGLFQAAQKLGPNQRIDRIGCSIERDLGVRLSAAAADAYGSWCYDDDGKLKNEEGFTNWIMQMIRTSRNSSNPAITVKTRSIEVQLPVGMTRRVFDRALHHGLERSSLKRLHPNAVRFTNYSVGTDRMSQALEFYTGLDPRYDGDRLLTIIEGIVENYQAAKQPRLPRDQPVPLPPSLPSCTIAPTSSFRRLRRMTAAQFRAMRARRRKNGKPL